MHKDLFTMQTIKSPENNEIITFIKIGNMNNRIFRILLKNVVRHRC